MASDLASGSVRLRYVFLKAILGLVGGLGLFLVPPANASCQLKNIPEEYRPLDLSEGAVNSLGKPVVGGPAASTIAERKCREIKTTQSWYQTLGIATDESTETLIAGILDAFFSGGSWSYDIFAQMERDFEFPVDPEFNAPKWIVENKQHYNIPDDYVGAFGRTGSVLEAHALLADIHARSTALVRLQRMGQPFRFLAYGVASLPDIAVASFSFGVLLISALAVTRRKGAVKSSGNHAEN